MDDVAVGISNSCCKHKLENSEMTKKDIHVVPNNDGWVTKTEGATRAGVAVATHKAAIERARGKAKLERVEFVIHRKDSTIRESDSYGNDPNPPRDTKN